MFKALSIRRRSSLHIILWILLTLIGSATALADDVTLAWDANSEADLAGYKIYYGTSSGNYGNPITIGKSTTYTVTNLPAGKYYFAVTAYNTAGLESGFSNEVSTTIGSTTSACDGNGDGSVNVLDLQRMINKILGAQGGSGNDLNGDGTVNVLDLQILGNVILGIRSCP